jgi:hypothetical protein
MPTPPNVKDRAIQVRAQDSVITTPLGTPVLPLVSIFGKRQL